MYRRTSPSLSLALLAAAVSFAAVGPTTAAVSIYVSPEQLAESAPLIVEGTVSRTASGFDPVTESLNTYVTVAISFVHRGPANLSTLVVRELGGHFDDLYHDVDAVPVYRLGEKVLLFLEPGRDGVLRTAGMFFGKFELVDDAAGQRVARREMSGLGRIASLAPPRYEDFPAGQIGALASSVALAASRRPLSEPGFLAQPPEYARLLWDDVAAPRSGGGREPDFEPLSTSAPVRWHESDSGTAVNVEIERARDPLGNPQGAVDEMKRAMAAWTGVPEARLVLQAGNDNYNFTGSNASSPSAAYPPVSILLFGDPYNDISDPSGCSGTLAIGGYWRSGSNQKTVNNRSFYPALRLYVIFNNNFECFLGNRDNLAEVATHELGHGIGFGHSTVADAAMRASAYGNRGPRLGNDDKDGAHCHYPHTLTVSQPNGGQNWQAGSQQSLLWTVTNENGTDKGTVSLEYSIDGGANWKPIASNEANDGGYTWSVPSDPSTSAKVRVIRPNRVSPTPAPYPSACSLDPTDNVFTITAAAAGTAPDGRSGSTPLRAVRAAGTQITLSWGASCSAGATDYAIYEGTLDALRSGSWNHTAKTCSAGLDRSETITPGTGARYYLIAPLTGSSEGRLGKTSAGADRPTASTPCRPREASSCP
ncbi:MAG: matrixin family metalloprotease [Acidobacteria bacterium]|jgi:hypothetical protein|nr:matrixin family metalloprotease [Acidobacteriota bacterium]